MDTATKNAQITPNEKLLYTQFRRKINNEAARAQIKKLEYDLADEKAGLNYLKTACTDANSLGLGAVCAMPCFVKQCAVYLGMQRKCSLVACVGAPRGGDVTEIKVKAVKRAIKDGADPRRKFFLREKGIQKTAFGNQKQIFAHRFAVQYAYR